MRFTPKNRQDWRSWLEANQANKTEIWLVFLKKTTGKPNLSYNDAVEEALCFGWIDGVKRSIDEERYMHRFTPRKPRSKWSSTNKERAQRLIKAGQMSSAGTRAIELARENGAWENPVSPQTSTAMPPELGRELKKNRKAAEFFAGLAPSYQRQYMVWIASAKRPETKIRRLNETMALLSRGEKLGMR